MLSIIALIFAVVVGLFLFTVIFGAPYVPSRKKELKYALDELRPISEVDLVCDIGSGDGVVCLEVAKRGARAVGYEINPILVWISKFRLRKFKGLISIEMCNFWNVYFHKDTTVVYIFGESRDINKMFDKVQSESNRLNKTIDVISYGFMAANRKELKTIRAYHLYTVSPLQ